LVALKKSVALKKYQLGDPQAARGLLWARTLVDPLRSVQVVQVVQVWAEHPLHLRR
jgi:hypothetical protein